METKTVQHEGCNITVKNVVTAGDYVQWQDGCHGPDGVRRAGLGQLSLVLTLCTKITTMDGVTIYTHGNRAEAEALSVGLFVAALRACNEVMDAAMPTPADQGN